MRGIKPGSIVRAVEDSMFGSIKRDSYYEVIKITHFGLILVSDLTKDGIGWHHSLFVACDDLTKLEKALYGL